MYFRNPTDDQLMIRQLSLQFKYAGTQQILVST